MKLGVYVGPNKVRFENALKPFRKKVEWLRMYPQPATTCTAAQISSAISGYSSAGYKVYFSFKSSFSWDNVAAGSDDSRWTDIGNMLNGLATPGAWCFNHEPENDPPDPFKGSDSYGDSFCAAFNHIATIIKPLAPKWHASPCLFDEVFPSWPFTRGTNWQDPPDPNRWWPTEGTLLGVDYYWYRGATDGDVNKHWAQTNTVTDSNEAISEFLAYAKSWGVPLCFPEYGSSRRDPATDGFANEDEYRRLTWMRKVANDWALDPRIISAMYFEVNDQDEVKVNWSITDDDKPPTFPATVEAFARLDGTPISTGYPTPEHDLAGELIGSSDTPYTPEPGLPWIEVR